MGTLIDVLAPVLNGLKVALGLGFVIFIHELGHFLLAKWNGVKVEKFSIGFGPTLFGFQRGETEYVLAAVPLGGFVKMLGENPEGEIAQSADPRAFHNKSVGGRMAIISAGVIMNILFGILCNVFVFSQPREELSPRVGMVNPGSPAYEAGLRPGDEVITIDGQKEIGFRDLMRKVILSGEGQELNFVVKRAGVAEPLSYKIKPRREADPDRPVIGVQPGFSLELEGFVPPAGMENPPTYPVADETTRKLTTDFVTAVAVEGAPPKPVATIDDLQEVMARNASKPLILSIERRPDASDSTTKPSQFTFKLPPNPFVDFGMHLQIGPILSVQRDSPAEKSGFQAGDTIVQAGGQDDFDPMRLPALWYEGRGKPFTFVVERQREDGKADKIALTVTPGETAPWLDPYASNSALEIPGLGICYQVLPRVRSVAPGSPAAKAEIKPGDAIDSVTIPSRAPAEPGKAAEKEKSDKPEKPLPPQKLKVDAPPAWIRAFVILQTASLRPITLSLNEGKKTVDVQPVRESAWFNPARGLVFQPLTKKVPGRDFVAACRAGVEETYSNVIDIYTMLRGLFQRRIGASNLGGPIQIAQIAYRAAEMSWTDLIGFLGAMSINLAVLNFLPIPPLDGGQMIFLLVEKVRGRPLPESIVIGALYIGLPLVLLVMVFATYQDVFRLVKSFFGP